MRVPGVVAGIQAYFSVVFPQKYKNHLYQRINRNYLQYFRKKEENPRVSGAHEPRFKHPG
jgi:hypothetical protein